MDSGLAWPPLPPRPFQFNDEVAQSRLVSASKQFILSLVSSPHLLSDVSVYPLSRLLGLIADELGDRWEQLVHSHYLRPA
jgi:hypothetical protein